MRTKMIAGNWKMHHRPQEARAFVEELGRVLRARNELYGPLKEGVAEAVLFPTALSLAAVQDALGDLPVSLGAQNAHWEDHGAFTGEIGAPMLADFGCAYILIGHSERRHLFHETEVELARKLRAVLSTSARCLFCVGELLEEREAGKTHQVLERQLLGALEGVTIPDLTDRFAVAYEPVWAIGTGKTASDGDAEEGCGYIRRLVADRYGQETAQHLQVLYGGSVKPGNTAGLMAQGNIDGLLVGGASLEVPSFVGILEAALGTLRP